METGRTSSSGGNAGNVQNVRRAEGTRECFTPREGWVYIGVDFDKAELHTVSQTCIDIFGRSTMAEALNAGKDPHTMLGARLAGMSYEEAVERLRLKDKIVKEWRQRAKPGNFGFLGGMGALGMQAYAKAQYGVKMTLEECEQLLTGWQETWPVEAVEYLNWIRELCAGGGYADIKHFISNRWRTRIPYCVAANSFFQGRAADGAKKALYEVVRRCYSDPNSALYGCRPVNFVHDEIITEAPLDRASDAAWEKRDVMVEAFNHFTPDVPVRATPVLMDRWSKSAEHLVDSNGNLQVWHYEPEAAAA
jgi:DNA polymerase I-like protein with 3'-5' exonuclease and polymerase domains